MQPALQHIATDFQAPGLSNLVGRIALLAPGEEGAGAVKGGIDVDAVFPQQSRQEQLVMALQPAKSHTEQPIVVRHHLRILGKMARTKSVFKWYRLAWDRVTVGNGVH